MSDVSLDHVFGVIERAAVMNRRCPFNGGPEGLTPILIGVLARLGRIRVEISGHNYRTVLILDGPHKGKRTKPDPSGSEVWKVVDTRGTRRAERSVAA